MVANYKRVEEKEPNVKEELDQLIASISKNVIESTVNESLKDSSRIFSNQAPSIENSLNKLKKESEILIELNRNTKNIVNELNSLNVQSINSNLKSLQLDLNKNSNQIEKAAIKLKENTEIFNNQIPEKFKELENSFLKKLIKLESNIKESNATTESNIKKHFSILFIFNIILMTGMFVYVFIL